MTRLLGLAPPNHVPIDRNHQLNSFETYYMIIRKLTNQDSQSPFNKSDDRNKLINRVCTFEFQEAIDMKDTSSKPITPPQEILPNG